MDNPWLLLTLGLVVPLVSYTLWGLIELFSAQPAALPCMAEQQGVSAPFFRLASGDPEEVNALLDELGFERSRDPETGVIDHANLFLLVDRDGRIAYRFTLGEQQERWLGEALELLVGERRADS